MIPGRHAVLAPFFQRGVLLWLGVRALASLITMLAGGDPLRTPLGTALLLAMLTVTAGIADTSRRHEWALLGNLMVRPLALAGIFAASAVAGEVVLHALGTVLR